MVGSPPQITVIVATFNAAKTLQQCLDSIARQTYPHRELIVMDGGSTDGTVEIIEANAANISYWESEPDRGVYHAWNKALDHASGDWVWFLGADDYFWEPDVLERMVPHLKGIRADGTRVVYGRVAFMTTRGKVLEIIGEPWKSVEKRFRQEMTLPHAGTLHHRSLFEARGKFDETFRISGDYDLLLRELKTREACFVSVVVAGMQIGGLSSVPALQLENLREIARARRNNGLTAFSPRLFRRLLRASARAWITRVIGPKATGQLIDSYKTLKGQPKRWT